MPIANTKKRQAFIQYFLNGVIDNLEESQANAETARTKWIAHNPGSADEILTASQVSDMNALKSGLDTLLADHATIIATLKAKDVPSHGIKSLD